MSESQVELIRRIAKDVVYEILEEETSEFWDYLNAVDAGIAAARQHVKQRKGLAVKEEKQALNPDAIKWQLQPGLNNPKGPFEKSEDFNNLDHQSLVKKLAENKGFFRYAGFQYWLYANGSTIGRRALKKTGSRGS